MIIHGHGVALGPVERQHLEQMRAWRNNPLIYRWCRQNDLISDVAQEEWFRRQHEDPSIKMYMIYPRSDDSRGYSSKPVGVCGLTSIDLYNRRAEFSLYIAPEFHKCGYGKRALQTLLDHGFKNLNLNVIWGETFYGNPAAKMFEALGMKKEGTRRAFYFKDGQYQDAALYSLMADEWLRDSSWAGASPS